MISAIKARRLADERQDYLEEVEEQLEYVEDKIKEAADKGLYMIYVSFDSGEALLPEVVKEIKNNGFYLREVEEEFGVEYLIDWNENDWDEK